MSGGGGGKCPGGICPWGKCPGGKCPGGYAQNKRLSEHHWLLTITSHVSTPATPRVVALQIHRLPAGGV